MPLMACSPGLQHALHGPCIFHAMRECLHGIAARSPVRSSALQGARGHQAQLRDLLCKASAGTTSLCCAGSVRRDTGKECASSVHHRGEINWALSLLVDASLVQQQRPVGVDMSIMLAAPTPCEASARSVFCHYSCACMAQEELASLCAGPIPPRERGVVGSERAVRGRAEAAANAAGRGGESGRVQGFDQASKQRGAARRKDQGHTCRGRSQQGRGRPRVQHDTSRIVRARCL